MQIITILCTTLFPATVHARVMNRRVAIGPLANGTTVPSLTVNPAASRGPTATPTQASSRPAFSYQPTSNPTKSSVTTKSPTVFPSLKPTSLPTKAPRHEESWLTFFLKLIGWLTFTGLSVILFGMCMSYRYHLYYFLLQSWYILRRSSCSRRIRDIFCCRRSTSSSNDFLDSDVVEGLLLYDRG